jgi:hypothetical protein
VPSCAVMYPGRQRWTIHSPAIQATSATPGKGSTVLANWSIRHQGKRTPTTCMRGRSKPMSVACAQNSHRISEKRLTAFEIACSINALPCAGSAPFRVPSRHRRRCQSNVSILVMERARSMALQGHTGHCGRPRVPVPDKRTSSDCSIGAAVNPVHAFEPTQIFVKQAGLLWSGKLQLLGGRHIDL